ncbi:MAG: ROK family protein [Flavipsychrobacter sp.]|nr:ROK family protein [Flavipsychrobacter sp.]
MTDALVLGIDIGGTGTALGIIDRRGRILVQSTMPTTGHATVYGFIDALAKEAEMLMKQVGRERMAGVGIGAPNANFFTGEIMYAPNLPWDGVIPLARLVKDALRLKVVITNDANAAAIGEMTYGAAIGMKDFVVVTLGTGLGSGFVANGQLIYGHDGFAGELGHVIAVRDGRKCACGRNGCLETYVSATGLVRTAQLWLEDRETETSLRKYEDNIRASVIFKEAEAGDQFAIDIFEYTGKILGQALADVVAITSPQAIIFFGGVSKAGNLLLTPVRRHMEDNLLRIYKNKVELQISALPDADAAILGAGALAW